MHKILALLFLSLFSFATNAAEISFPGKVFEILNHEAVPGPVVRTDNMVPTNGVCPRNDYYILPLTHKYFKQNYELLLAAKLTNKTIWITVDNPGNCVEAMNRIKHLSITD